MHELLTDRVISKSVESSKLLLAAGADPNDWWSEYGHKWTLLTYSAYKHNLDAVKLLLHAGADVELTCTFMNRATPAIVAALINPRWRFQIPCEKIVEALLDGGTNESTT